eukprot:TRINITY_DN5776_c0_g4_i5.p2 TRINITY_DN5776_c0_g4~~TRINITY_DN5776_c0_g4_i5.p2  ORF type:complete len:151 (+),score=19.72 TRINITY_DN5776_c0_g4_i5:431-883(+)
MQHQSYKHIQIIYYTSSSLSSRQILPSSALPGRKQMTQEHGRAPPFFWRVGPVISGYSMHTHTSHSPPTHAPMLRDVPYFPHNLTSPSWSPPETRQGPRPGLRQRHRAIYFTHPSSSYILSSPLILSLPSPPTPSCHQPHPFSITPSLSS